MRKHYIKLQFIQKVPIILIDLHKQNIFSCTTSASVLPIFNLFVELAQVSPPSFDYISQSQFFLGSFESECVQISCSVLDKRIRLANMLYFNKFSTYPVRKDHMLFALKRWSWPRWISCRDLNASTCTYQDRFDQLVTMSFLASESCLFHFSPVSHFCTPWKRLKTFGFLTLSVGIEL